MDKYIQKILDDNDKGELLEHFTEELPKARRILVIFETPRDNETNLIDYHYAQFGFSRYYEMHGFLDLAYELIELKEE